MEGFAFLLILTAIGAAVWLVWFARKITSTASSTDQVKRQNILPDRDAPRSVQPPCTYPGCAESSRTWCGGCEERFCGTHGGWIPYGREIEFVCDHCWNRDRKPDGEAIDSRYETPEEATGDMMRRNFPFRDSIRFGAKHRVYELKCPHCGKTGTASYSDDGGGKKTSWHLESVSSGFNHNEYSNGGAEVYCPHYGYGRLVCDPNATGSVDDVL